MTWSQFASSHKLGLNWSPSLDQLLAFFQRGHVVRGVLISTIRDRLHARPRRPRPNRRGDSPGLNRVSKQFFRCGLAQSQTNFTTCNAPVTGRFPGVRYVTRQMWGRPMMHQHPDDNFETIDGKTIRLGNKCMVVASGNARWASRACSAVNRRKAVSEPDGLRV